MIGIHKLFLCLAGGGGVALTSCAVAIPMSLNTNKNSTENQVSVEIREEKRESSKSIAEVSFDAQKDKEIKEGLSRNWKDVKIRWRPLCGVSHPSLCLIPSTS